MKTLLLLRHAKSSWKFPELDDHDRPLNKRGKRDAPRVGERLDREGLVPDLIVTSTAQRARDTARLLAEGCSFGGEIETDASLYEADAETCVIALRRLPETVGSVLLVGHNPTFEDLLEALTGAWERFQTAALAQVELDVDRWQDVEADGASRLVRVWRPREEP